MVHSVAAGNGKIYAAQNGKIFRIDGSDIKSIDLDLRKIGLVHNGEYLVGLTNETKDVTVVDAANLEVKATHTFPKRPSAWTVCGDWLVVSDKFGDVFKAPLLTAQDQPETSEDGFGSAILGHVSMVLALAATSNRIFSSDRDEHIRISAFPDSFVIDKFLLGHHAYVSQLVLDGKYLLSSGGDPYAIAWDWESGKELKRFDLAAASGKPEEEVGVISAVIAGKKAYFALEDCTKVISADFPSFENSEVVEISEPVHSLASDGASVYVATASAVRKLGAEPVKLEGESSYEIVSEKHLRKR